MRTPRTVDEIADAILPASIDGLHERALCLLLAEHERSFHELENRCRLLESRSYAANERLDALDRCEPGEEGRGCDGVATPPSSQPSSAAASDRRAPGSTAPTTSTARAEALADRLQDGGRHRDADDVRALAAARDRLARSVESYKWDAQRHAQAEDAIARRIEAMRVREPTLDELDTIYRLLGNPNAPQQRWREVFRYVRNRIATPTPEPLSEPRCGLATASEGPTRDHAPLYSDGETYHCHRCGKDFTQRGPCMGPAPQPTPATPSADWEDLARSLYLVAFPDGGNDWDNDSSPKEYWIRVAAEVSRREAGLREDYQTMKGWADNYRLQVEKGLVRIAELERDLAAYERKRRGKS